MTMRAMLDRLTQQEDLNFLLTNRIPRQALTRFMGWFSKIKDAIFGSAEAKTVQAKAAPPPPPPAAAAAPAAPPPPPPPLTAAQLDEVLTSMAAKAPQKLNWNSSIVDLMKLVGLDPSLANRKELASELGYTGALDGSAEMNIWLHKKVMEQLRATLA